EGALLPTRRRERAPRPPRGASTIARLVAARARGSPSLSVGARGGAEEARPPRQAPPRRAPPLARSERLPRERVRARARRHDRRVRDRARRLGEPRRGREAEAPAQPRVPPLARDVLRD